MDFLQTSIDQKSWISRKSLATPMREHRLSSMWLRKLMLEINQNSLSTDRNAIRRPSLPNHIRLSTANVASSNFRLHTSRSAARISAAPSSTCNQSLQLPIQNLTMSAFAVLPEADASCSLSLNSHASCVSLCSNVTPVLSNSTKQMPISALGISRCLRSRTLSLPCNRVSPHFNSQARLHLIHAAAIAHNARQTLFRCDSNESKRLVLRSSDSLFDFKKTSNVTKTSFTSAQVASLICIFSIQFVYNSYLAVLPAFFPSHAARNGLSEFQCSFVFSVSPALNVLLTPFLGSFLSRFGARPVLVVGLLLNASAIMLFGTFDTMRTPWMYLMFCLGCRSIEAIGTCMHSTANYMYILQLFPHHIAFVFGFFETFVGLGLSLGPVIGGFLMAYFGYQVTFNFFSVAILLCVPFSFCALPTNKAKTKANAETCSHNSVDSSQFGSDVFMVKGERSSKTSPSIEIGALPAADTANSPVSSYWDILKQPQTLCIAMLIVLMPTCQTFVDPSLELYLERYHLTAQWIGFEFLIFSSATSFCSPVVGLFAVHRTASYRLMICGLIITVLGFLLVGPSPWLPFLTPSLPITSFGLLLLGLGLGVTFVPTFQSLIDCSLESGFEDAKETHAKLAALAHLLLSVGEAVGPAIGGLFSRWFAFPMSSTLMAVICTVMLPLLIIRYYQLGQTYNLTHCSLDGEWKKRFLQTKQMFKTQMVTQVQSNVIGQTRKLGV